MFEIILWHVRLCFFDKSLTLKLSDFYQRHFISRIFGTNCFDNELQIVKDEAKRMGFGSSTIEDHLPALLSEALLANKSPYICDLSLDILSQVREKVRGKKGLLQACYTLSQALYNIGIIPQILSYESTKHVTRQLGVNDSVPQEWFEWVERWYSATTCVATTKNSRRVIITKAGRWFAATYNLTSPAQWTRETCMAYVSAVENMTVGEWMHPKSKVGNRKIGKNLSPNTKVNFITSLRSFFLDCQEFQWLPMLFSPTRYLTVPPSIKQQVKVSPRVVPDGVWAKIVHAAITLKKEDVPRRVKPLLVPGEAKVLDDPYYPWELVRAVTIVWIFAGLRAGEIKRLSVGCVSWGDDFNSDDTNGKDRICYLRVPINKTSGEFIKPVDYLVGQAIESWQQVRPAGQPHWDSKSGREVQYLFIWRGKYIGKSYLNNKIIPMLCKKAGMPKDTALGVITSHWARSTIATQLFNGQDPMGIIDLQQWLGHKSLNSTQHYVNIGLTKLAKSYTDAGYFERNIRRINVLIDQDVVMSGKASAGEPWRFYDLGHGFCTYDFFDTCKHRMACAKCSFYKPKESSYMQIIEAKDNLLRMQQSIPLTEEEVAAVDDGIEALNKLANSLLDAPTPQGLTPREMKTDGSDC